MIKVKLLLTGVFSLFLLLPLSAQQVLSLDSCRQLALNNNKQLRVAQLKQEAARNTRKAMFTKYLPKIDALGGYEFTSRELSLLNGEQKAVLNNLGTLVGSQMSSSLPTTFTSLVQQGVITPQQAVALGNMARQMGTSVSQSLNEAGQRIRKAFETDTRNVFMGSVVLKQPVFMGGGIIAANKLAELNEQLAEENMEGRLQNTLYEVDHAYWTVVSLRQKQQLAQQYLQLVEKLDSNVYKMISNGVATRADGLQVDVRVNEAQMTLTQVDNGLTLARMFLCQLCGLPMDSAVELLDEMGNVTESSYLVTDYQVEEAMSHRPELKMLRTAVDMSEQKTRLERSAYLPQVALTAGYLVTNPNAFNSYERRFSGMWNVGVMLRVPVWNWMEGTFKVRASKAMTAMAELELSEAREKVELQLNQSSFKMKEAAKRLQVAAKNTERAEENLRCANLGFSEGVMQTTDVMAAQTAWLQARTQEIDAQIDIRLAHTDLQKALGKLQ